MVRALLGDMDEDPAIKKVVSGMYLSLGEAARKLFKDKYPHTTLWNLKARELIQLATECYHVKRNRTLDRHKFFSRMQQQGETLQQFWHALNGLAALCDFGEITNTLVLDMFILHMGNKKVQEKLCTEPKEPEQALEFDIAYEEGVKRQKSYGTQQATTSSPKTVVKSEPFVEACCNKKFPQRHKEMINCLKSRNNSQGMRRVNYIDEDTEEDKTDDNEEQFVLQIDGNGTKPFFMEGTMCGTYFEAIIDTGSPVSMFTKKDLQKIIGERKVVIRDMIDNERYVGYNKNPYKYWDINLYA